MKNLIYILTTVLFILFSPISISQGTSKLQEPTKEEIQELISSEDFTAFVCMGWKKVHYEGKTGYLHEYFNEKYKLQSYLMVFPDGSIMEVFENGVVVDAFQLHAEIYKEFVKRLTHGVDKYCLKA